MTPLLTRAIVAAVLPLMGGTVSRAQVVATPDSVRVLLPQGSEYQAGVHLFNHGGTPFEFCLDFDRPIQRVPTGSLGAGCGAPGELLMRLDVGPELDIGDPWWMTMTPDGRLFVAGWGSALTAELDADLNYVRTFSHPEVAELSPFPETRGVTFNEHTGTLWWTNVEALGDDIRRVMLLEGTMDGVATGRRIVLPGVGGPAPAPSPRGAAYEPAMGRYYYVDRRNQHVWAVDTLGMPVEGYPRRLDVYPQYGIGNGLAVHGGSTGGPEGVRLDVPALMAFEPRWTRVVVTDPAGTDLGIETPVPALGLHQETNSGTVVRSTVAPNHVMFTVFLAGTGTSGVTGILAFRPVRLSPTWLGVGDWYGTLPADGTSEIALTFRAGQRTPGEYRSTLVVEDTAGVVLASVPLTLVVEPDTPAEPSPESEMGVRLAVSPNPITASATATITLAAPASDATVTVHDVLGRQAALVHHGPLTAGDTALALDARSLPAGAYVVRALVDGVAVAQRMTVLR